MIEGLVIRESPLSAEQLGVGDDPSIVHPGAASGAFMLLPWYT